MLKFTIVLVAYVVTGSICGLYIEGNLVYIPSTLVGIFGALWAVTPRS